MKRTVVRLSLILGLLGLVLGPSQRANALTNSFDVINFKPATDSTRFITLYDGDNHAKGEWNAGFYIDYAHHPLELGAPQGVRRIGVVDDTIVWDLLGSYGFTNWFEAGVRVPVVMFNNYKGIIDPANPNLLSVAKDDFSMGDVSVNLKFRLLNNKWVGIAVVPFITAPSGRSTTFMGNGRITGGGTLAVHFDPHARIRLGLNAGFIAKPNVTVVNTQISNQVPLSAAINIKPHNRFDIIAEGSVIPTTANFFGSKRQTPAEVDGAIRVHVTKSIDVTAGGGAGLTIGVGSPDFRAFLGFNYTHHKEEAPPPRAPKIEAKKITIDQMIHFDFDKSNIRPDAAEILKDVAKVMQANPQVKKIRIESHCDAIGSDAYNMKLSDRRANSTRDYLIKMGVDPNRLEAVGYGKSRPIATNKTAAGRAMNRRSEFNVIEQ